MIGVLLRNLLGRIGGKSTLVGLAAGAVVSAMLVWYVQNKLHGVTERNDLVARLERNAAQVERLQDLWAAESALRAIEAAKLQRDLRAITERVESSRGRVREIVREVPVNEAGTCQFTEEATAALEAISKAANGGRE